VLVGWVNLDEALLLAISFLKDDVPKVGLHFLDHLISFI
jgi:hypothetical protein